MLSADNDLSCEALMPRYIRDTLVPFNTLEVSYCSTTNVRLSAYLVYIFFRSVQYGGISY